MNQRNQLVLNMLQDISESITKLDNKVSAPRPFEQLEANNKALQIRNDVLEMELKEERVALRMYKSERDSLEREYDKAIKDRNQWHDKAQEYKAQRDEYRESRDKWCEAAVREQLATEDALPRIITADEVREGQVVAASAPVESWYVGKINDEGVVTDAYSGTRYIHAKRAKTLFLLADAPEPEPMPTLPEQEGALIQVTELNEVADKVWGEFLPFFAYLEAHEVFGTTWISTTGEIAVAPHQIVGWLPVRAVES